MPEWKVDLPKWKGDLLFLQGGVLKTFGIGLIVPYFGCVSPEKGVVPVAFHVVPVCLPPLVEGRLFSRPRLSSILSLCRRSFPHRRCGASLVMFNQPIPPGPFIRRRGWSRLISSPASPGLPGTGRTIGLSPTEGAAQYCCFKQNHSLPGSSRVPLRCNNGGPWPTEAKSILPRHMPRPS